MKNELLEPEDYRWVKLSTGEEILMTGTELSRRINDPVLIRTLNVSHELGMHYLQLIDTSVFTNKLSVPGDGDLFVELNRTYPLWKEIRNHVHRLNRTVTDEWHFSEQFGWSFRIRDDKRVIVYLLPRENFFKVGFVFGQKATTAVLNSEVSEHIRNRLRLAEVHVGGCGIKIDIRNQDLLNDIRQLIEIKLAH